MKTSLVLIMSCSLAISRATAVDLGPLVEKVADAYGGRERLEKLAAIRETGTVTAASQVGSSGPIVRTFARPARLRIQVGQPEHPREVRVLDGAKGWRNGQAVTGMSYEAMLLQAIRLDLPFQLLTRQAKVVEKEPIDFQGKHLRVLELPLEHDLSVTAGIEPETGHILFSKGTTASGAMGRMTFETQYDDFHTVDGLLFAFKETNLAGGAKTADTILLSIEMLKTAPEEAFQPQKP
jgi:hypothetical protein